MHCSDVVLLFAKMTAFDGKDRRTTTGAGDVQDRRGDPAVWAWADALAEAGVTDLDDAIAAVNRWFARNDGWIMPAHIVAGVHEIQAGRLRELKATGGGAEALMDDVDADAVSGTEWVELMRARRAEVIAGRTPTEAKALHATSAPLRALTDGGVRG